MDADPKSVAEPVQEEFTVSFIPDDVSGRRKSISEQDTPGLLAATAASCALRTVSYISACLSLISP